MCSNSTLRAMKRGGRASNDTKKGSFRVTQQRCDNTVFRLESPTKYVELPGCNLLAEKMADWMGVVPVVEVEKRRKNTRER